MIQVLYMLIMILPPLLITRITVRSVLLKDFPRCLIFFAILLALLNPSGAAAQTNWLDGDGALSGFQATNGDFGTSTFWNTNNNGVGTLTTWPGATTVAVINANGTNNITVNSSVTASNVFLANSPTNGTDTTVNLSGSSTLTVTNFSVGQTTVNTNNTATATLNQSSGTITASGTLGVGRNGTTGIWNMTGGSASGAQLWIGLDVRGGNSGTGTVAPSGAVTISGGNMAVNGNVFLGRGASNGVAQTANATLNITNTGSLTAGTVFVGFGNHSTGTVNLNGGTLTANNVQMSSGLTNTTSTFRFNGGTLKAGTSSATFMTGLTFAYVDSGGAIIDMDGKTNTISQTLLQGTGAGGLTFSSSAGAGRLTLSGTNSYVGSTTINGGTLLTLGGRALSDTASVILANAAGANLNVNASETIGGLQGGGATGGTVNIAGSQTLTVTNQATSHTFSGVVAGAGSLNKTGTGTLALSGNNTYTGSTTVTAGSLIINGDQSGANGFLNVAANATLGGSGTIGGATTINGIIAPGNSIGTLSVANDVTWNAGNNWVFELGAAGPSILSPGTSDLLAITGGNDFRKGTGSTFTFDFAGTGGFGWYKLVDWAGGSTDFDALDFSGLNLAGDFTSDFTIQNNALYVNVVPEPSTYALFVLSAAAMGIYMRRRRRS